MREFYGKDVQLDCKKVTWFWKEVAAD